MDLSLANRRALACGSTQGIGKAAAIELAVLGASVTLLALAIANQLPTSSVSA